MLLLVLATAVSWPLHALQIVSACVPTPGGASTGNAWSTVTPTDPYNAEIPPPARPQRYGAISADGSRVVFTSAASDLLDLDAGATPQAYSRDTVAGTTSLVSVDAAGDGPANGATYAVGASADGRWVLLQSWASDLVAGGVDANGARDVFVRDTLLGTTLLVSVAQDGSHSGAGGSRAIAITPDGRHVLFDSQADDLVAGDGNGGSDVFVRDLQLGVTTLVSVTAAGEQTGNGGSEASALTPDGRYVLFSSSVPDLIGGMLVGTSQVYVRDLSGAITTRVSVDASGLPLGGIPVGIASDGSVVLFESGNEVPFPLGQVYLRDVPLATTRLVSRNAAGVGGGNGRSDHSALSADGRFVAFSSQASDLVAGDDNGQRDVFRYDRLTDALTLVSVRALADGPGNDGSYWPAVNADGSLVAFVSRATDIVAADSDGTPDVYLRDMELEVTTLVSEPGETPAPPPPVPWIQVNQTPLFAADGVTLVFASDAPNLVGDDRNGVADVFLARSPRLVFRDGFEASLARWSGVHSGP